MAHPKFFILDVDDDTEGMDFNSLVDLPAHMKSFISFSTDGKVREKQFKDHFDDEKRIVTGVAIATYLPIKRYDEENGEHFVIFTEESARKIWTKMCKNGYINQVNEMHDSNKDIKGMTMFESFGVDKENGIFPEHFKEQNLKKGSVIVSYFVENDQTWSDIKSGKVKGFSVEGWFKKTPMKMKGETFTALADPNSYKLAKISEINTWDIEVMEEAVDFGTILHYAVCDCEGLVKDGGKIRSGEYTGPDGKKIMVDSMGKVVMIDGKTQMQQLNKNKMKKPVTTPTSLYKRLFGKEKFETATTVDGVVLSWEGELKEGVEVKIPAADEAQPASLAPEGDHTIPGPDGMMRIVSVDGNGKVVKITDVPKEENDAATEQAMRELMKRQDTAIEKVKTEMKKASDDAIAAVKKTYDEKFKTQEALIAELAKSIDKINGVETGAAGSQNNNSGGGTGAKKEPGYRKLLKRQSSTEDNE